MKMSKYVGIYITHCCDIYCYSINCALVGCNKNNKPQKVHTAVHSSLQRGTTYRSINFTTASTGNDRM